MSISPQRRTEILDALRRGTVPAQGLDALAVGLDRFAATFDEELDRVASGAGVFKAIRGEYGAGKTFITRWLAERAKARGFATSEVQISETDTPMHRYQTIYRRLVEQLSTPTVRTGGLRSVIDSWFFSLEDEVLAAGNVDHNDAAGAHRNGPPSSWNSASPVDHPHRSGVLGRASCVPRSHQHRRPSDRRRLAGLARRTTPRRGIGQTLRRHQR